MKAVADCLHEVWQCVPRKQLERARFKAMKPDDDATASLLSRGPHEEGIQQTCHNRTDERDIFPVVVHLVKLEAAHPCLCAKFLPQQFLFQ
eukprot:49085-Rhodomonas_salina.1